MNTRLLTALCAAMTTITAFAADDILIADFEQPTYGDWKAEGDAFGPGPAKGTLAGQKAVTGFEGTGLVNTFRNGDGSTGTLTSPPFVLERDYLRFLIGGGSHPTTALQLLHSCRSVAQKISARST